MSAEVLQSLLLRKRKNEVRKVFQYRNHPFAEQSGNARQLERYEGRDPKNINSKKPIVAIGSGGNINKVFSMSKTKDGKPMSLSHLKRYIRSLMILRLMKE
jgi:hypothetical protein